MVERIDQVDKIAKTKLDFRTARLGQGWPFLRTILSQAVLCGLRSSRLGRLRACRGVLVLRWRGDHGLWLRRNGTGLRGLVTRFSTDDYIGSKFYHQNTGSSATARTRPILAGMTIITSTLLHRHMAGFLLRR